MSNPDGYSVLDLFSGAGGMSLGFKAAGAQSIGAVDADSSASQTYRQMFARDNLIVLGGEQGDVNHIQMEQLGEMLSASPDLIIGGPPCQGFSVAGRGKHASLLDPKTRARQGGVHQPQRNLLYRFFLRALSFFRPKAFVIENVPGIRHIMGIDMAQRIAREAAACGYNVRYFMLNASWYGVPQHRWRVFFVGISREYGPRAIPLPPPRTHLGHTSLPEGTALPSDPMMVGCDEIPQVSELLPVVRVRDAIHDLPVLKSHLQGEPPKEARLPPRRAPSFWVTQLNKTFELPVPEELSGNWYRFNPRDFRIFRQMSHGDRYPDALQIAHQLFQEHIIKLREQGQVCAIESNEYQDIRKKFIPPYRKDTFAEKWRKLIPEEPSWTVTAHLSRDSYSHIHYSSAQARTITIREAARLQSFPDGFDFCGSHGDAFRQIGNAVPPLLAHAIAKQLFKQLEFFGS